MTDRIKTSQGTAGTETVSCPNCGESKASVLFEGRDVLYGVPGVFPVRRCALCGLIYISPRPTAAELASYYPDEYGPHTIPDDSVSIPGAGQKHLAWRIGLIERFAPSRGRVLDVGCATGQMLDGLRARGWEVCGVEPGVNAAAYARDRRGLNVRQGTLRESQFPDAHFDVVCFWHSLEHVPDPKETLREAARVARPGATLLLSLPNPDCGMARWFGPYWCGWDVPRHLCLFPRNVLTRMLEETGWSEVRLQTRGGRHWYVTLSLENRARERNTVFSRGLSRIIALTPVVTLATPLYVFLERFRLGPNLLAIARRAK